MHKGVAIPQKKIQATTSQEITSTIKKTTHNKQ
jgi:hypothetical protein